MLKISSALFSSRASASSSLPSSSRQVLRCRAPSFLKSTTTAPSVNSQRSRCPPFSFRHTNFNNPKSACSFASSSSAASSATNPIHEKIAKDVKSHKVVLYMKGTPEQPMCGFSRDVVHMLNSAGADYVAFNVLESPELREGIKKFSNWPTIPQVFVAGEFIGGRDITWSLYQSGELRDLLLKNSALVPEAVEDAKKQHEQSAAKQK